MSSPSSDVRLMAVDEVEGAEVCGDAEDAEVWSDGDGEGVPEADAVALAGTLGTALVKPGITGMFGLPGCVVVAGGVTGPVGAVVLPVVGCCGVVGWVVGGVVVGAGGVATLRHDMSVTRNEPSQPLLLIQAEAGGSSSRPSTAML